MVSHGARPPRFFPAGWEKAPVPTDCMLILIERKEPPRILDRAAVLPDSRYCAGRAVCIAAGGFPGAEEAAGAGAPPRGQRIMRDQNPTSL